METKKKSELKQFLKFVVKDVTDEIAYYTAKIAVMQKKNKKK